MLLQGTQTTTERCFQGHLGNQRTRPQTTNWSKIARFIMGTTPTNHRKEVMYNIKGNLRQPEDMPTELHNTLQAAKGS